MIIIANVVSKDRVPLYLSMIGGMYGIASIIGPLVCYRCASHWELSC